MAEIVNMPKLGFDMAEGTLIRWVVAEGESVAKGGVLAEIETDKATVEVESAFDGVVAKHLVEQGTVVPVGTPIVVIAAPGEKVDAASLPGGAAPQEKKAPAAEEKTEQPQTPATVAPGEQQGAPAAAAGGGADGADGNLPAGVRISPLARRMAEEQGIDLRLLKGTGPLGRITRKDIEGYQKNQAAAPAPAPAPATQAPAAPAKPAAPAPEKPSVPLAPLAAVGPAPADQHVPLTRLRGAIGRRMVEAKQQVPHFYVTHEYNVEQLMALRKQVNALLPDQEKLSVNDFIVKAVALTLRQFPNVNASLNGNEVVRHGQVNVGNAVSVEGGLLTVVCRDTDRKPLRQISQEVRSMAARAREGKVRPDDIEGSTFSVSNLGMYDVENFSAIINPPEAGILAVGSAREVPVVENGQVKPGWRMKATISIDHRVSDGAEAARFMQALAAYLEQPMLLLL